MLRNSFLKIAISIFLKNAIFFLIYIKKNYNSNFVCKIYEKKKLLNIANKFIPKPIKIFDFLFKKKKTLKNQP